VLEVEPAAVEANTLADDAHEGIARAAPPQVDEARRARAAAPDRVHCGVLARERRAGDDADAGVVAPRERTRGGRELGRPEVRGRYVDEIADHADGLDHAPRLRAVRAHRPHELAARAHLLARQVAVEDVRLEGP